MPFILDFEERVFKVSVLHMSSKPMGGSMTYVRDNWYPAAWSREIERALSKRTLLEQNIVLYRKMDGTIAALEDLCPHRFLPLSQGNLIDDNVQCGYHGLIFNCTGACVRVPGREGKKIPSVISVRHYPVHESMGLVWIWMGDPDKADTSKIFHLPQYDMDDWSVVHGDALHISANYLSLADNLCDPMHVAYVHESTLGNKEGLGVPITCERTDYGQLTTRWLIDVPPIPLFKKFFSFQGNVDRWQLYHFHAPSAAIIDFGSADTGNGAPDGNRDDCVQIFACHFLAPVDERNSIDYWLHVKNFVPNDADIDEKLTDQFRLAFNEDKDVLEYIQTAEDKYKDRKPIRLAIDQAPLQMREIVTKMIEQEQRVH